MADHMHPESLKSLWDRLYNDGLTQLRERSGYARILLASVLLVDLIVPLVIFLGFWIWALREEGQARSHDLIAPIIGNWDVSFATEEAKIRAAAALLMVLLLLTSKIFLGAMVLGSGWVDLASFRKAVRRKRLLLVSKEDEPALHREAFKIAAAMGIDISRLRIWVSLSPSSLPNVVGTRWINLIAPMGFANMAEDDPSSCDAILAHEFAHILHRDTQLWRRVQAISWALCRVSIPIVAFQLMIAPVNLAREPRVLANAISWIVNSGIIILLVLPMVLEYATYRSLVHSRLLSEDLADFASVIRTSPAALIEAIRRYVGPAINELHRPKQNRIDRIMSLVQATGSTDIEGRPEVGLRTLVAWILPGLLSCILVIILLDGFAFNRYLGEDPNQINFLYIPTRNDWSVAAYSPDGSEIATASTKGRVSIWHLNDLDPRPIDIPTRPFRSPFVRDDEEYDDTDIEALAYSDNGSSLIAATATGETWEWRRNEESWSQISSGFGSEPPSREDVVTIAENGQTVAVQRSNGEFGILEVSSKLWRRLVPETRITKIAFAADGHRFVTLDEGGAVEWRSIESAQSVLLGSVGKGIRDITVRADGSLVAALDWTGVIYLFRTDGSGSETLRLEEKGDASALVFPKSEPEVLAVLWRPDDDPRRFLSGGLTLKNLKSNQTRVLNVTGLKLWFSPRSSSVVTIRSSGPPIISKLNLSWDF